MVEVERPEAFSRQGTARRVASDTPGLWAAVTGLPRPESARLRNTETGAEAVVALFEAPRGSDRNTIALSPEAAEAIGLAGNRSAIVTLVALRREPTVQAGDDSF